MYAQLVHFDGPRSPELVAAGERAGLERLQPAVLADAQVRDALIATYVLRQPNGAEVVVIITETAEALQRGNELIAVAPLLPGEDPALLPGPDRIETYEVVHAFSGDRSESEARS
jgi:hypothetical protein